MIEPQKLDRIAPLASCVEIISAISFDALALKRLNKGFCNSVLRWAGVEAQANV
jgi:hypothetical protein